MLHLFQFVDSSASSIFLRTDVKLDRKHYCDKSWLSYHNYILLYVWAAALRAGAIVGSVSSQEHGYGAVRF